MATRVLVAVVCAALLAGCVIRGHGREISLIQLASADSTQRSKPPKDRKRPRPSQPTQQPGPEAKGAQPLPKGSGDPMPVSDQGDSQSIMGGVASAGRPGYPVPGLPGAVWADQNNDGSVDGYVYNGQYYAGTPQGYDPTLNRVATGPLGGASYGAVAGAVIPGVSVLEGAVIGAQVGGLAGAIWADRDNDGRVDGYVYNGQYYAGAPSATPPAKTPLYSPPPKPPNGERG